MISRQIARALRQPAGSSSKRCFASLSGSSNNALPTSISSPSFVPISSSVTQSQRLLSHRIPAPTRARILSRWYSTTEEAKKSEEGAAENPETSDAAAKEPQEDPVKKELEASKKEVVELKDKYLRQVAEYRNLQERTRREIQSAKDFAIQRFARDLVESIDTFDLALSTVSAEKLAPASEGAEDVHKDLRQLHDGLRMTESVLLSTLKKHGLERFDPSETGEKFDPNRHEAVFQTPQQDKTDGTVFHTTQKGFVLNGRVLRAAKVGVVKNS